MKTVAQIDENFVVVNSIAVADDVEDPVDYLANELGLPGLLIEVDARSVRGGIGDRYDKKKKRFFPPKPFDSWVWSNETQDWEAPIPRPGVAYYWSEEDLDWVLAPEFDVKLVD